MAAVFTPTYKWQPPGLSKHQWVKGLPLAKRKAWYESLSESAQESLKYDWSFWARPSQMIPPASVVPHKLGWKFWFFFGGRGTGKTRLAAETSRHLIETGQIKRFAICGPTYNDILQTMLKGPSGLISVFPPWNKRHPDRVRVKYIKGDRAVYFYRRDQLIATGLIYSGEKPDQQRGPNIDFAWFDELASFKYLDEVWKLFVGTHRLGSNPRAILTGTPKPALAHIKGLLDHPRTVVTFGSSKENQDNLSPDFISTLEGVYADTQFADQEMHGVLYLDDMGALFRSDWIQPVRVLVPNDPRAKHPIVRNGSNITIDGIMMQKFVVAVDPSGSSKKTACECGIIVAGLGIDSKVYIVEDRSRRCTPDEWARVACLAAKEWGNASIVFEKNYGDEMIGSVIRSAAQSLGMTVFTIPVDAQTNKTQRAMMVSPLVQRQRVRLVGYFGELEKQLYTWTTDSATSPDRLDAFVWAVTQLLLKQVPRGMVQSF